QLRLPGVSEPGGPGGAVQADRAGAGRDHAERAVPVGAGAEHDRDRGAPPAGEVLQRQPVLGRPGGGVTGCAVPGEPQARATGWSLKNPRARAWGSPVTAPSAPSASTRRPAWS